MFGLFKTPRKMEDLALFARHVSGAMGARVPLPDILRAFTRECESGALSRAVERIIERVESGVALSAAMEEHPKVFPEIVRRLTLLGERGRTLDGVMDQLADTLEESLKSYEQTRRAAIYPLLVTTLLFVTLTGLNFFILPKFAVIFQELGASGLPGEDFLSIGSMNIGFFQILSAMNILLLLPILVLVGSMVGLRARGFGPGRFILQLPLIGPVLRLAETSRFAHLMALLARNRVPMTEALAMVSDCSDNAYARRAIADLSRRYESGEMLGAMLGDQPIFPAGMAVMIAAAEDQGSLADTLDKLARFYNARTAHALTVTREVFEPLVLLAVGLLVGAALCFMYLPLFNITRTMR